MKVEVFGYHLELTDAIKTHVEEKLSRVSRHAEKIPTARVTLQVRNIDHIAEVDVSYQGKAYHAKAVSGDLYKSIDDMAQKLDTQVLRDKGKRAY